MATRLRLTRNQIAAISKDPETIRQLELLISSVNGLLSSSLGERVDADDVLTAGGTVLSVGLAAGTYHVTLTAMLDVVGGGGGDGALVSEAFSGGLVVAAGNWAEVVHVTAASAYIPVAVGTGALAFISAASTLLIIEALVTVTSPGVLGFTLAQQGAPTSATLLAGSGLTATLVTP